MVERLTITDSKEVHVVWANIDLTEGRWWRIPIAVCEIETTALRLAKGKGVQGSNFEKFRDSGGVKAELENVAPFRKSQQAKGE